jgi:hypothetical protein
MRYSYQRTTSSRKYRLQSSNFWRAEVHPLMIQKDWMKMSRSAAMILLVFIFSGFF